MANVWQRLYADLLMPPRLGIYQSLLVEALERGYVAHCIRSFWQLIAAGGVDHGGRYLVLRHDVDQDAGAAAIMWGIEQDLGVRASYYFRVASVSIALMQKMEQSGSEASYHYEQVATLAKERGLRSPEEVRRAMPAIRQRFKENLLLLRERTGLPMVTVAAHGDFANRRLGMPNTEILRDDRLRRELGIVLETYDEAMMRHVTSRHCDSSYPRTWDGEDPFVALRRGEGVVYVLTHPGHWRSDPAGRLRGNLSRLGEGIAYYLRTRNPG